MTGGRARRVVALGWALALGGAGTATAQRVRVDGFAARVNAQVITVGEVRREMDPEVQRLRLRYDGAELDARLDDAFERALRDLMERALLAAEFDRRELALPERAVEMEIGRIVAEVFGGSRGAFIEALADEGMTVARFRERNRMELKARVLYQQEVQRRVVVSPGAVRAAYAARTDAWRRPARIRIRAMEFAGGDAADRAARAEAERARVQAGEPFGEVAKAVSDGPAADAGGDWGWLVEDDLHGTLRAALEGADPGALAGPVALADRLFLMRVEDREAGRTRTLAEVFRELEAEVRVGEGERLRAELRDRLDRRHVAQVIGDDGR
jgi:parvulin-like peptidyl-prolyl isomerase